MDIPAQAQHLDAAAVTYQSPKMRSGQECGTDLKEVSGFFALPLEIWDQMYDLAFGTQPRFFRHTLFKVVAYKQQSSSGKTHKGLPPGLLSSKQICSEAISVFADTRYFELYPLYNRQPENTKDKDPRCSNTLHRLDAPHSSPHNPLVFDANVMRTLHLRPATYTDLCVTTAHRSLHCRNPLFIKNFLAFVGVLGGRNFCLHMAWNRWWHTFGAQRTSVWTKDDVDISDVLGDEWNSIFRKVTIRLQHKDKAGNAVQCMKQLAEKCASRLAGEADGASALLWGEEKWSGDGSLGWERALVMQRKL